MESVLGRYRNLIILVGVLFLQVLGLAVQVKRAGNDPENTRLIRIWAVDAITPFERGLVWVQNSGSNLWHNYFYLRGVRAENRQLKEQIEDMRLEQVRLREDAAQAHRLQNLLSFKEQFISRTVAAQVVGSSGSDLSRTVYIDKGENAGLKRDMAVITADGVVGKVMLVYPAVAQVLLINDQTSGVGVILEKSRLQGVLRGTSDGEVVLERVMSDEQVPVGETVLTSGGDQIFPKGLPVGTITKVGNGKELFLNIKVKPSANISRLEEVLVLTEKQERQAVADDSARVRAADVLAQRLPSVPDKPATDASAGPGTPAGSAKAAAPPTPGTKLAGTTTTPARPNGNSKAVPGNGTGSSASPAVGSKSSNPVSGGTKTPGITAKSATTPRPAAPSIKPADAPPIKPEPSLRSHPSDQPPDSQPPPDPNSPQ
jgi:rod shape-determining protein MreC